MSPRYDLGYEDSETARLSNLFMDDAEDFSHIVDPAGELETSPGYGRSIFDSQQSELLQDSIDNLDGLQNSGSGIEELLAASSYGKIPDINAEQKTAGVLIGILPLLAGLLKGKKGIKVGGEIGAKASAGYFDELGKKQEKEAKYNELLAMAGVKSKLKREEKLADAPRPEFLRTLEEQAGVPANTFQNTAEATAYRLMEDAKRKKEGTPEKVESLPVKESKELSKKVSGIRELYDVSNYLVSDSKVLETIKRSGELKNAMKTYADTLQGKIDKSIWEKMFGGLNPDNLSSSEIEEAGYQRALAQLNPNSSEGFLFQKLREIGRLRAGANEVGVLTEKDVQFYYDMLSPKYLESTETFSKRLGVLLDQDVKRFITDLESLERAKIDPKTLQLYRDDVLNILKGSKKEERVSPVVSSLSKVPASARIQALRDRGWTDEMLRAKGIIR